MARTQNRLTDFGKTVVKALIEQDMTKTELAEQIGTSPEYLSYILRGVRSGEKYRQPIIAALRLNNQQTKPQ